MALSAEQLRAQVLDTLGLGTEEVGDTDDLLELGLDSIRLMSLVERWRADGADIGFVELTEDPTIAAWQRKLV
ncbi:phosphopantetheine-binding protein [Sciscionella marina]|uniref:phosphopantetheine-binding protein n=1 Tax=Sciscionella marina TaxID=508770 RepID=UPI000378B6F5|nr:phosphopantetheine-binding protein [Sciscionella marina]